MIVAELIFRRVGKATCPPARLLLWPFGYKKSTACIIGESL